MTETAGRSELTPVSESLHAQWYREVIVFPFGNGGHLDAPVEEDAIGEPHRLPQDAIGFKYYRKVTQDYFDETGERRTMTDIVYRPGSFFVKGVLISLADLKGMGQHELAEQMITEGINNLLKLSENAFVMFRSDDRLLAQDT